MNLYNNDENGAQGRFFSPAKVARVRKRIAIVEET